MMVMIRVALLILGVTQALLGIFSGAALAKGIAGIGIAKSNNINLYVNFAKPCDSPDYPREACISEFYDVRVLFDPVARRFAVQADARNLYWGAPGPSIKEYGGFCGYDRNPSKVYSNRYCDLPRRYVAFAISRTEDPRKGFHQYMLTESNFRDWPWMSVNGNTFVVAHLGRGSATSPVATVFSMQALKSGSQNPPNFRYYGKHVAGVGSVLPASHYGPTSGLTFLLGNNNQGLQIFAFQEPSNPWLRPPLRHASLKHNSLRPSRVGVVFRNGMLHALANVIVEEFKGRKRYSIRVLRIPIQKTPSGIKVSQDASRGYLARTFGRSGPGDSPGDRVSYERPALAVNKYGDMFIGYGRYPFQVNKPLMPEVRYTLWYGNESKQRRSRLLRGGQSPEGPACDRLPGLRNRRCGSQR